MNDKPASVIGDCPPPVPGYDWENQCARCGSSVDLTRCSEIFCNADGDNWSDDDGDLGPCDVCGGKGHWWTCLSSPEWCEANPLPGREHVRQGSIEWFAVREDFRG